MFHKLPKKQEKTKTAYAILKESVEKKGEDDEKDSVT